MAASVNFTTKGFFNGVWPLSHLNWASYFAPTVQDGVIAGVGGELVVDATSTGMNVRIQTGECRVHSHRGSLESISTIDISAAHATYNRIDLVVARVTYSASPTMVITTRKGTAAANPVCPSPVQTAGSTWEIPLAEVFVAKGAVTIAATDVTDRRYVYNTSGNAAISFSGTTLRVENDWEYRNNGEVDSLTITLPAEPSDTFICGVCFSASADFSGVTFMRGSTEYSIKTTDNLTYQGTRYNLVIWWDGAYYWCGAKAA